MAILLAPAAAFASFDQAKQGGQTQVQALTPQQLDSLNTRVFSDAFLAAKIVGFDRAEIDQLTADMQALKQENAQLRAALSSRPVAQVATSPAPGLEGRVAKPRRPKRWQNYRNSGLPLVPCNGLPAPN